MHFKLPVFLSFLPTFNTIQQRTTCALLSTPPISLLNHSHSSHPLIHSPSSCITHISLFFLLTFPHDYSYFLFNQEVSTNLLLQSSQLTVYVSSDPYYPCLAFTTRCSFVVLTYYVHTTIAPHHHGIMIFSKLLLPWAENQPQLKAVSKEHHLIPTCTR